MSSTASSPCRLASCSHTPPAGKSALILGATGSVGKHLLTELLASPYYTRVGEFGRRVTPPDALGPAAREKLVQKTLDFDKLGEADDQGLREGKWDVVFITYVRPWILDMFSY